MSMDNGHIIRKNDAGRYVLQMYSASSNNMPVLEQGGDVGFPTLELACAEYARRENDSSDYGYPLDEYGLHIDRSCLS